ncbi:hypothetical protein [Pollutimonas nitritireducens]|uniref:hypothetical protein n=1 Tax=Pollutimonas nitritireducens TaxID=2045209 RepID=UPI0013045496|nr:hypothetical protein [Pollutimonas nitritireducens]
MLAVDNRDLPSSKLANMSVGAQIQWREPLRARHGGWHDTATLPGLLALAV